MLRLCLVAFAIVAVVINAGTIDLTTNTLRNPHIREAIDALRRLRRPNFKPDAYFMGTHDNFLGVNTKDVNAIAATVTSRDSFSTAEAFEALASPYNEERQLSLQLLHHEFEKAAQVLIYGKDAAEREAAKTLRTNLVHELIHRIPTQLNNWNLVDMAAPSILGSYVAYFPEERKLLLKLRHSPSVWARRASIVSTLPLITRGSFTELSIIASSLFADPERHVRRAVVWVLSRGGELNEDFLVRFINTHGSEIPDAVRKHATKGLSPSALSRIHPPQPGPQQASVGQAVQDTR